MSNELTNAPAPPAKDPLTPGKLTSEFLLTGGGLFLSSLVSLLAVFNVLHLSPEQEQAVYQFTAIAWIVLPSIYAMARSHVKAKALSPPAQTGASATAVASEK